MMPGDTGMTRIARMTRIKGKTRMTGIPGVTKMTKMNGMSETLG